ncbi:MAG: hypothetical protein WCL27_14925 [Betaproteobacteria bacterium]
MAHRLTHCCGFLLALLGCVCAQAQSSLSDPTRPPASVFSATPETGGVTGPVLQSVFLPRKGKPFAVIGGETVKLGELYGDSRLIKLTEREAVLEGPAGIEHLLLTPGIEKTNIITKTITKTPVAKRAPRGSTP